MNLIKKLREWLFPVEGYSLTFTVEVHDKLQELSIKGGFKDFRYMLAHATALLDASITVQKEGGQVIFRSKDGKEEVLNQLPVSVD